MAKILSMLTAEERIHFVWQQHPKYELQSFSRRAGTYMRPGHAYAAAVKSPGMSVDGYSLASTYQWHIAFEQMNIQQSLEQSSINQIRHDRCCSCQIPLDRAAKLLTQRVKCPTKMRNPSLVCNAICEQSMTPRFYVNYLGAYQDTQSCARLPIGANPSRRMHIVTTQSGIIALV
jgi:hypothetical protein